MQQQHPRQNQQQQVLFNVFPVSQIAYITWNNEKKKTKSPFLFSASSSFSYCISYVILQYCFDAISITRKFCCFSCRHICLRIESKKKKKIPEKSETLFLNPMFLYFFLQHMCVFFYISIFFFLLQ